MLLIHCPHCGDRNEVEFHCGGESHIVERAIAVIAIEGVPAEIVDDVQIRKAVAIVVAPYRAQAQSQLADPGLFGDIGEGTIPVVVVELIGQTVSRIESGRNIRPRVQISPDIEIEKAVIVVIGPGSDCRTAILGDPRLLSDLSERSVSVVMK